MPSDTPLTLHEIRRKIDNTLQTLVELRGIENGLMQKYLPAAEHIELFLQFDDTAQTVSWFGKVIFLNAKPYLLLKTIWNAPEHCAYLETLEKEVWNCSDNEDVSIETIKSLVKRTNTILETHNAPLKIQPLKCTRTGIDGYRL
jgi:DNA-binding response OmpR family regulator